MGYKVIVTQEAEEDLDRFIAYLINERNSKQAAKSVLDDFEATKQCLSDVAGSLKLCDNPALRELGYRRINFMSHRYFMLYRIEKNKVIVDAIFHGWQDFEDKMM